MLIDVVNRGNTVSVPNFNHATRPALALGADPPIGTSLTYAVRFWDAWGA